MSTTLVQILEISLAANGTRTGGRGSGSGGGGGGGRRQPVGGRVRTPSLRTILIVICVLQSLALLTTIFRLIHRTFRRKLWWDDFWAGIAFISDLTLFVFYLVIRLNIVRRNPTSFDNFQKWMTLLTYTTALWTSRLSISVTITRLLTQGKTRKLSKLASSVFVIFWVTLLIQKVFFCGKNWHDAARCSIPKYTGILELVTDNLADLWLLLAPAYILYKMKLKPMHRNMIIAIFACGILTLLASITHSVFILIDSPSWVGISGHIQVTIAIVVSNLLVLVTAVYRALRRRGQSADTTSISNKPAGASPNDTGTRAPMPLDSEAGPGSEPYLSSQISLTELSNLGSSIEMRTASFASTAPFSSFSYPSSHMQSNQDRAQTASEPFMTGAPESLADSTVEPRVSSERPSPKDEGNIL